MVASRANRTWAAMIAAILAAVAAVGPNACGPPQSPAGARSERAARAGSETLIGAAWPWTRRPDLQYGRGLDLAIDEINAAGGVNGRQLRLVREDDDERVDTGRLVAQRFAANLDVVAVIGHLQSYVTEPAAAIYDVAGLILIAPTATAPELTSRGYRRVFRGIFTDLETGRQMAEYAAERGFKRVAVYYARGSYGLDMANAFEQRANERDVVVVDRRSFDPDMELSAASLEPMLDDWKQRDLNAIFIASEAAAAAAWLKHARQRGLTVPVLGADALGTPALFSAGAAAVEGTVMAAPFHAASGSPQVQQFVIAFHRRYGATPDASAALGYDAVQLLAHAMRVTRTSDPARLAQALHEEPGWLGVTGRFQFDSRGDLVNRGVLLVEARNGQLVHLNRRTAR